jgi:hypothetical protein
MGAERQAPAGTSWVPPLGVRTVGDSHHVSYDGILAAPQSQASTWRQDHRLRRRPGDYATFGGSETMLGRGFHRKIWNRPMTVIRLSRQKFDSTRHFLSNVIVYGHLVQ